MNVIIRVVDTGEVLDLFPKVALENTITSAFLSEDGSKAIPISLPITDKNTRIFGFSKRIDRANKGNKEIDVIVSKGSYSRKGKLYLSSSSNSEWSYSATIAYNEAILYDLQSKLKLTQLPNLPIEKDTVDNFIVKMYKLLTVDDVTNPLTVFQIYLKSVGTWKHKPIPGNDEYEVDVEEPFILNENRKEFGEVKFILKDKIIIVKDGVQKKLDAAKGIGLSPFVHVWYVIECIAEHYGYTMGTNQMKEDPQLVRATLLNNTADAIVGGFLDYKQLMPDKTISEFFQYIWARHGAKVFIDGNTNTMHVKLIKNCINEKYISQLPVSGLVDIEYSQPKQLKLTASKNLEDSSTEVDTYEEFCTKYNNTIGNYWYDAREDGIGGVVLDEPRGLFYHIPMSEFDSNGERYDIKPISSIHFDWDKKDEGLEYVEITSPDECLTSAWYGMNGMYPYYGVDFALKNSRMQVERIIENRDASNKLAVCWDMGQLYNGDGINRREEVGYKFGSIYPYTPSVAKLTQYYYDAQGNKFKYAMTWIGKDGCFEHFWKDYDAILRHSGDVVKGKIALQPFELSSLDISKPYIVDNQKILLQDYSYIVGNIDVERQEFNAITLGLYLPHDLEKEQSHPKPDPILYKWALMTNKEEKLDIKLQSIIDGFEETAFKKFVSCEWTKIEDNTPPNMDGLAYYPPSKVQVDSRDKIGESKHDLKATYKLKWRVLEGGEIGELPKWVDYESTGTYTDKYDAWFQAVDRYS